MFTYIIHVLIVHLHNTHFIVLGFVCFDGTGEFFRMQVWNHKFEGDLNLLNLPRPPGQISWIDFLCLETKGAFLRLSGLENH